MTRRDVIISQGSRCIGDRGPLAGIRIGSNRHRRRHRGGLRRGGGVVPAVDQDEQTDEQQCATDPPNGGARKRKAGFGRDHGGHGWVRVRAGNPSGAGMRNRQFPRRILRSPHWDSSRKAGPIPNDGAIRPWSFPVISPHRKSSPPRRIGRGSLLRPRFSTQLFVEPREHAVPSVTTAGGERVVVTGPGNLHPRFGFGRFREQFTAL